MSASLSFYRTTQHLAPKHFATRLVLLSLAVFVVPLGIIGAVGTWTGQSGRSLIVWAALATAFSALLQGWMIRALMEPLHLAVQSMEAYARSRAFPRGALKSEDDLGRLFNVSERMAWRMESLIAELEALAVTDDLTGLLNRRAFSQRVKEALAQARRGRANFGLAVLDLDRFQEINDTLGASAGDSILRDIAALLRNTVREYDVIGRWAGQEFAILMPTTTLEEAQKACERLRAAIEQAGLGRIEGKSLTVSFGVTGFEITDLHADDVVKRADWLVRQAKARGRNRVEATPLALPAPDHSAA